MKYNFPEIKTSRKATEQVEKIVNEIDEYLEDFSKEDEEAIDILHAVETFIRIQFKDREEILDRIIREVITKNSKRNYYTNMCY